jgi:hypothetical protein
VRRGRPKPLPIAGTSYEPGYFLGIRGAGKDLGRSVSWIRQRLNEIPHGKKDGQLVFERDAIRAWMKRTTDWHVPVDVNAIIQNALNCHDPKRKQAAR